MPDLVAKNLAAYRWGRRPVVSSPDILGGEPVFRGSRIPVQHVASLFRKGVPESEIAEDFRLSMLVIWPMPDWSLASENGQGALGSGLHLRGSMGSPSDSPVVGREYLASVGRQTS